MLIVSAPFGSCVIYALERFTPNPKRHWQTKHTGFIPICCVMLKLLTRTKLGRLWRSLKYEEVYLKVYTTPRETELKRQLAEELDTVKRLREKSKVNCYEFMLEHLLFFSVVRMVKMFKVSRSGLYYWIKHRHKAIQRKATRQEFDAKVEDAFDNNKERDGSRRIKKALAENGDSHKNHCS